MTTVYLFETPFDSSGKHLLIPTTKSVDGFLTDLINAFPFRRFDSTTWERQGQTFRCPIRADEIRRYNYMAYKNESRIEFAYITDYQYCNNRLTYVTTYIDYWSTYIDKFVFHDSPICRMHPATDAALANFVPEPCQIDRWNISRTEFGDHEDDDDSVMLLTANDTDTYKNRMSDFFAAIATFAMGDYAQMGDFFSTVKVSPCNCNGLIQANTSKLTREEAVDLVQRYAKCGRQEDIIGAYHVPKPFATIKKGENITSIADVHGEIEVIQEYGEKPLWNKIYTSPQFNKLSVNCGGSAKEYDFRYFDDGALLDRKVTFKWTANQSQLGGIIITPVNYGNGTNGDFSVASSSWDSVQLSTTQLNTNSVARSVGTFGLATVGNLISLDLKSTLQDAETFAENLGNAYQDSDITIGNPTGNITMYNAMFPMISVAWYKPSIQDIQKLNRYFCMYGYNYNGAMAPIETNSLPIVNYVHTSGAIVTAADTPQDAVTYMRSLLDSGVWFWHGVDNYKRTDKILENHF